MVLKSFLHTLYAWLVTKASFTINNVLDLFLFCSDDDHLSIIDLEILVSDLRIPSPMCIIYILHNGHYSANGRLMDDLETSVSLPG